MKGEFHQLGHNGLLIYLNANPSLDSVLEKIEGMGGTVLSPKTKISTEISYMAIFQDTEGNKVALHSQE